MLGSNLSAGDGPKLAGADGLPSSPPLPVVVALAPSTGPDDGRHRTKGHSY